MATTFIRTPDPNIDSSFRRLDVLLQTYKLPMNDPSVWTPDVPGYGIDKRCAKVNDTRDNRWLVWAARYFEPDDAYLDLAAPAILEHAFTPDGVELHEHLAPGRDDFFHHVAWWLLQVALGYVYTGDTSIDTRRIRLIVDKAYEMYDTQNVGMLHTGYSYFVTSIGEPMNATRRRAYPFFNLCNLIYSFDAFAHLARARRDQESAQYFDERKLAISKHIDAFRSPEGFYYALKDTETGEFLYRIAGPEDVSVMTDNVFFPLAFGVLSEAQLRPSLDFLLPKLMSSFPVPYAVPSYRGEGGLGWWIPRSWQECLAHFCLGLREIEMCAPIYDAIKRQADRFAEDDEVWENYDPETGSPHDYFVPSRKGYATTPACFNIAVIETLFGLRPESPGFASVSLRPAFPEHWPFAEIDLTVNRRRFHVQMTAEEHRVVYDFTGSEAVPAHMILPLPRSWSGRPVKTGVEAQLRVLRGESRPCIEAHLPLRGRIVIES